MARSARPAQAAQPGAHGEPSRRYHLPIVTVVFNNGGIYRGDDVNHSGGTDPAPTVLMKDACYEKLIEAFGGDGYYAADPQDLAKALTDALASGKPALINCPIDP